MLTRRALLASGATLALIRPGFAVETFAVTHTAAEWKKLLTPEQIEGKSSQGYQSWYAGVRNGDNVKNQMTPEGRTWLLRQAAKAPRPS